MNDITRSTLSLTLYRCVRSTSAPPLASLASPAEKMFSSFLVWRAPMNFLLNGWEHFSAGLSALNASGRRGSSEFRHGPASTTAKLAEHRQVLVSSRFRSRCSVSALAPSAHAGFVLRGVDFRIFRYGRRSSGGFPLRRKLTEFNAVMLRLVTFH